MLPIAGPSQGPSIVRMTGMNKLLASQVAGFRLLWIVLLFLVPVSYLGWQLTSDRWKMADASRAHHDGLALMDLTFHVMLDLTLGGDVSSRDDEMTVDGARLAIGSGVTTDFNQFISILHEANKGKGEKLQAGAAFMEAIGATVGLGQAGNQEAHFLTVLASEKVPQLLVDYNNLKEHVIDSDNGPVSDSQFYTVQWEIADLEFEARDTSNEVHRVRVLSDDMPSYSPILQPAWWVLFDAANFRTILSNRSDSADNLMHVLRANVAQTSPKWLRSLREVWEGLHKRLTDIGQAKHNEFVSWASRTFAISLSAVLLGLGIAISMFRRTLRQLDEVDLARKEAIIARAESEISASDLSELNSEMAKINFEMSDTIKALKDAQDQLVKKGRMEQMGQLIATIAHELRNPLGAVRTSAFLLERKTKGLGLGIEGQLQRINKGVTRCDDIITQLLDFSRNKQIATKAQDLDKWLESIIAEEAQNLPQAVSISCLLGLNGLKVPFDDKRLHRAVANLLSNASEAMVGNGEEANRQSAGTPHITVTTAHDGEYACVEVRDNGPGIAHENMDRIREPLFTTKSFGTGLGLPAVEQILTQHNGRLEIDSEPGKYAAFRLVLPLAVQEKAFA